MIESMTGYGESRTTIPALGDQAIVCRARSLNHRFMDIKVRLPRSEMTALDIAVRKLAGETFKRGALEITVAFDHSSSNASHALPVNKDAAREYFKAAQALQGELSKTSHVPVTMLTMDGLMRLPGVIATERTDVVLDADSEAKLLALVRTTLEQLRKERQKEGISLENHLNKILAEIESHYSKIIELEPTERKKAQDMMVERAKKTVQMLAENASSSGLANLPPEFESRLREEAVFWIERRDFDEEKVRFIAHIQRFKELMKSSSGSGLGRQLEFTHQELGREINTLGNKAQSTAISAHVVEIKSWLERLREQLANVE